MDSFFSKQVCDRCGKDLKGGRIMSMLDTSCLCMECHEREKMDKDYEKAVEAEHAAIRRGDFSFPGIRQAGMKKVLFTLGARNIQELKQRRVGMLNQSVFVIKDLIELPAAEYEAFTRDLTQPQAFIHDRVSKMFIDAKKIWHCILVRQEGTPAGILVQSGGADYAKYTAYYEPEGYVSDIVLDQITKLRTLGTVNMLDVPRVRIEARRNEFHELDSYLEKHKNNYISFIFDGKR